MVGGLRFARKFAGPHFPFQSWDNVATALRCSGFKPLPIEIIARRKVAPAFDPQSADGRVSYFGLLTIKKGRNVGGPGR